MQIFRHHSELPAELKGSVVAVGNFDGVHRGHQIVIADAQAVAKATGVPLAVLSFDAGEEGGPPIRSVVQGIVGVVS